MDLAAAFVLCFPGRLVLLLLMSSMPPCLRAETSWRPPSLIYSCYGLGRITRPTYRRRRVVFPGFIKNSKRCRLKAARATRSSVSVLWRSNVSLTFLTRVTRSWTKSLLRLWRVCSSLPCVEEEERKKKKLRKKTKNSTQKTPLND